jgi:hypothetical protein
MNYIINVLQQLLISYIGIYIINKTLTILDDYTFKKSNTYIERIKKYKENKNKIMIENKTRIWYALHAIINTWIAATVFSDFIKISIDPFSGFDKIQNTFGLALSISLHLFHIVSSYKHMDIIEWMHHIISCMFVGCVAMFYLKGRLINYILFFLCGFPGGIDYYMLALNKYELLDRMTEKRINSELNMWIRLPGISYACFVGWLGFVYKKQPFNSFLFLLVLFLNFYNATYFAQRVVKNYGFHLCMEKNNKKINKNTIELQEDDKETIKLESDI